MTQGNTYIGASNDLLERPTTISATSAATGYPATNAATWLTAERWKVTTSGNTFYRVDFLGPVYIDSFGIYAHNLADAAGSFSVQGSNDDGATWSGVNASIDVTTSAPIFRRLPGGATYSSYRFWFVTSSGFSIGVIFLGQALRMEAPPGDGFRPPIFSQQPDVQNNRAQNGNLLGRSILRNAGDITYSFPLVEETWSRANLPALKEHMTLYPWFFAWDSVNYPDDVGFCWTENSGVEIQYNQLIYHSLRIKAKILTR